MLYIVKKNTVQCFKRSTYYFFLLLLIAFSIYCPWQYYIFYHFPNEAKWENAYNFLHLNQSVEGHSGEWWWHINYARIVWNELFYLIFLWFSLFFIKNRQDKKLWVLAIWITIPYLFFSAVGTKMWAYILFTAPAMFIVEAMFLWHIKHIETQFRYLRNFLFYTTIILAIRYGYERVKPFHNDVHYASVERSRKIKELSRYFLPNEKNIVFGLEGYIECMFYHNNTIAYPNIPNEGIIDSLEKLNYKIFIVNYANKDTLTPSKKNVKVINF